MNIKDMTTEQASAEKPGMEDIFPGLSSDGKANPFPKGSEPAGGFSKSVGKEANPSLRNDGADIFS
jgi:hypothetical protein